MKLFIDLETLLYSLKTEKRISKLITGSEELQSLPYNSKVLQFMSENYKEANIVLLVKEKYESDCKRACAELKFFNNDNWNVSYFCYKNQQDKIDMIDKDCVYISDCVRDKALLRTNENVLISDIFNCFSAFALRKKISKIISLGFLGLFSIFFSHLSFIIPILILWPAFFEINSSIINQKALEYSIYAAINVFFFSSLLRSILELDSERKEYMKGFVPLCSSEFIYRPTSLKFALFYLILSAMIAVFLSIKNAYSIFPTLILGFANFSCLLFPKTARYLTLSIAMIFTQTICQWKFVKFFIQSLGLI